MRSVASLTVVLGALLFGAVSAPAAMGAPVKTAISDKGKLRADGGAVFVGGKAPACGRNRSVTLKVELRQKGKVAKGAWGSACPGPRLDWDATVRGKKGSFKPGRARVTVRATIRKGRKVVSQSTVSRAIKLSENGDGPVRGGKVYGGITFDLGVGVSIAVRGGGGGTSNCTYNESYEGFTTAQSSERHLVSFDYKKSGSCWNEYAWSRFEVVASGPGVAGDGGSALGEFDGWAPFKTFGMTCQKGFYSTEFDWRDLNCERTGTYEIKITKP